MVAAQEALVLRRTLSAPPELVFQVWTQPEHMLKWFGPTPEFTNPFIEVDLQVGGKYRVAFDAPELDRPAVVGGEFVTVQPPRKLVYTWQWEPPNEHAGVQTLVTVEFLPCHEGTELVLTHEKIPHAQMRESHSQGWSGALDRLPAALEQLS